MELEPFPTINFNAVGFKLENMLRKRFHSGEMNFLWMKPVIIW